MKESTLSNMAPPSTDAFYKFALDQATDGIRMTDENGVVVNVNDAFCRLVGMRKEDIEGKPMSVIYEKGQREHVLAQHQTRFASRTVARLLERKMILWNGQERSFEISNSFLDVDGSRPMLVSVFRDKTEQKRVEEALQHERALLRTLIDNLPDLIYVKDRNCRKTVANLADVRTMGRHSEAEVLGKDDFELFPKEVAEKFFADDQSVITTGQPVINREEYFIGTQGETRWLLTSKLPLRDKKGDIVGLVGVGHDITKRKQAEEVLRESERRLSDILQFFPSPTMVLDCARHVIAWNQAMELLTGVKAEDVIGKGDYEYALPFYGERRPMLVDLVMEPSDDIERRYVNINRQGDIISGEAYMPRIGDGQAYLHGTATVLRDSQGQVAGAIETLMDFTYRRKAELALKASEERFRLISENVADLITVLDLNGICLYASPSYRQEGLDPADLIGRDFLTHIHPDDAEEVGQKIAQILSQPKYQSMQFRFRRADGTLRFKEARMNLLVDDTSVKVVAVVRDVTERMEEEQHRSSLQQQLSQRNLELETALSEMKQMQQGLVQSEKMASIGQLTAGIAHEINNPLAFVASNLNRFKEYFEEVLAVLRRWDSLAEELEQDARYQTRVRNLVQAEKEMDLQFIVGDFAALMGHTKDGTERIKSIVERLRGFTHLADSGFAGADINAAIDDSLTLTWNELKYKATIRKEYGDIPKVTCNIGEIKQVLVNLLVNAAQAIPEKGGIRVSTFRRDASVVIEVEDTGAGIPKANLKRIFDPFFTTKPVGKGTGLGLWISATIVQKHHGSLTARSEEGRGTVMSIELPLEQH